MRCLQLFPYHLADYVCRILRVTPFKYYCDLLYTVMREEKSYDQIPNFAVRLAQGLRYEFCASRGAGRLPSWHLSAPAGQRVHAGTPADC